MVVERAAPRSRTLLPAQIELLAGDMRIDCLVRDLSETGARLAVSDAVAVPERFRLVIPKLERQHRAVMRWRRDGLVGVAFLDERDPDTPDRRAEAYRRTLEDENRRLRRLLASIKADPSQAGAILVREQL